MTLIELLGSQQAVDEVKKAAQEVIETAIASGLGNVELDEEKMLAPLRETAGAIVDDTLKKLDAFIDVQLKKLGKMSFR